mgnify:CR=1 FL=1
MQISAMSKGNCEKLLLYFVTNRNHAAFKDFRLAPAEAPPAKDAAQQTKEYLEAREKFWEE